MWVISLFFVSVIALWGAWACLRKSMLDTSRDCLFDLRESVRETFIRKGWGLDSIEYKRIRDLINCAIRYAEDRTLFKVIRINRIISRNKTVSKSLREFKKEVLSSQNPEIESYLKKTYGMLSNEIFMHLLLSTAPIAALLFTIGVIHKLLRPFVVFSNQRPNPKEGHMKDFLAEAAESSRIQPQAA